MCGPHCSMKTTEDVRRFAPEQGVTEGKVVKDGLQEKAVEFAKGGEVYKRCDEHSPERDVNREQSGSLKVLGAQLYLQQLWQNGPL